MMNIEEEVGLSAHLLDHDYFHPVVYMNNPNEYEEIEVLENERIPADEEVLEEEEDPEENALNQVPATYRLIPGVHHGSRVYIDNLGFKYYKREIRVNPIYLVCERQKSQLHDYCPCAASVSTQLVDNRIKVRNQHNHGPADFNLHVPFLKEAIGARGIDHENMSVSVRTAYNNAIVQ
ncbi:hypothetical protein ACI65C_004736 [Semiaphis heraclei]